MLFSRVVLGALIGAAVMFLWGFVFWMFLPWSKQYGPQGLPAASEAAIRQAFIEHMPRTQPSGRKDAKQAGGVKEQKNENADPASKKEGEAEEKANKGEDQERQGGKKEESSPALATGVYILPYVDLELSDEERKPQEDRHRAGPIVQIFFTGRGAEVMHWTVLVKGFFVMFASTLVAGVLLARALPTMKDFGSRWIFITILGLFGLIAFRMSDAIWFHQPLGYNMFIGAFDVASWLLAGIPMAGFIRPETEEMAPMAPMTSPTPAAPGA